MRSWRTADLISVLTHLEDVNSIPLTAPNVDSATNIGMIQAM